MKIPKEISDRIVVVGIDPAGKGGISTVISQQKAMMESFNFVKVAAEGWRKFVLPFKALMQSFTYLPKKYKVVHVHACSDSDFYRSSMFIYLFKLMGKKVIMHMHGAMFEDFYRSHPSLVRNVCSKCDMVVTVSNYFVNFFKTEKLCRTVELLHNSIQPRNISTPAATSNKFIFSYFGAIDDRKGIFECIEAIGENVDSFRGIAEFRIGGNGNIDRLKSMIDRYGISDIVKYLGWINAEGKDKLLSDTDVFVHPSKFESFGISILEAMDYGLPIITTTNGGITDLVTDGVNGITVDAGSSRQIASAMLRLMNDSQLRRQLGFQSSERAKAFYPDNIAKRLLHIYSSLL